MNLLTKNKLGVNTKGGGKNGRGWVYIVGTET